jgi:hypothetical protein
LGHCLPHAYLPLAYLFLHHKKLFLQFQGPFFSFLETSVKALPVLSFVDIVSTERFVEIRLLLEFSSLLGEFLFLASNCL